MKRVPFNYYRAVINKETVACISTPSLFNQNALLITEFNAKGSIIHHHFCLNASNRLLPITLGYHATIKDNTLLIEMEMTDLSFKWDFNTLSYECSYAIKNTVENSLPVFFRTSYEWAYYPL